MGVATPLVVQAEPALVASRRSRDLPKAEAAYEIARVTAATIMAAAGAGGGAAGVGESAQAMGLTSAASVLRGRRGRPTASRKATYAGAAGPRPQSSSAVAMAGALFPCSSSRPRPGRPRVHQHYASLCWPADPAIYPITILTDEMRSEDTEVRINAMRKLRMVAATLGPERTRKELIPFLSGAARAGAAPGGRGSS